MVVDRSSGRYVGIAAWTDREALEASGHDAPDLIADLAQRLHGSKPSVEIFDLLLAHLVKPVRVGYWGRFARMEVPVQGFARAVQRFKDTVLAIFDGYDGLASIILFGDRTSGVLGNIVWYDSFRVLRGSATSAQEVRELLVADVPTVSYVEHSELQVVIAEGSRNRCSSTVAASFPNSDLHAGCASRCALGRAAAGHVTPGRAAGMPRHLTG